MPRAFSNVPFGLALTFEGTKYRILSEGAQFLLSRRFWRAGPRSQRIAPRFRSHR